MTKRNSDEMLISDDEKDKQTEKARLRLRATAERGRQWHDDCVRRFKSDLVRDGVDFDDVTLELVVDPETGGPLFVPCVTVEGHRFFIFPGAVVVTEEQMEAAR